MTFKRTLLLSSAALLLGGCPGSTLSLIKRMPPEECMRPVPPLLRLETGLQTELELWISDTAPKYTELRKNYECLETWAKDESEDDDEKP